MTKKQQKQTRRKHLSALSADKLELVQQKIDALPISKGAKAQLKAMLKAAANPDNERVDVIIATMPKDEQANIAATAQAVTNISASIMTRGRNALNDMSEAEWNRLLDEAENE